MHENVKTGNIDLGLCLSIDRYRAEQLISAQIQAGHNLFDTKIVTDEEMQAMKKAHWDWVVATCAVLNECFSSQSVSLHFSSAVYTKVSLKLNDLEKEIEEFPYMVQARCDRLFALINCLPVIPEPPADQFIKNIFHPVIAKKTWQHYIMADYESAVNSAFHEIEESVREAISQPSSIVSDEDLMKVAFDPETGYLSDKNNSQPISVAVRDLFDVAQKTYKDLASKQRISPNSQETAQLLVFASYLKSIIDKQTEEQKLPLEGFELLKDE
jgi:hypothetical protein